MHLEYPIMGGDFSKAGYASSQVKKVLKQLNISPKVVKRVAICLYEAEVNIVAHAYKGTIIVDIDTEKITTKLIDEGPGIPDINLAMQKGYSTASPAVREMGFGAGMGLPNIYKNADEFDLKSEVNKGTELTISIFLNSKE